MTTSAGSREAPQRWGGPAPHRPPPSPGPQLPPPSSRPAEVQDPPAPGESGRCAERGGGEETGNQPEAASRTSRPGPPAERTTHALSSGRSARAHFSGLGLCGLGAQAPPPPRARAPIGGAAQGACPGEFGRGRGGAGLGSGGRAGRGADCGRTGSRRRGKRPAGPGRAGTRGAGGSRRLPTRPAPPGRGGCAARTARPLARSVGAEQGAHGWR